MSVVIFRQDSKNKTNAKSLWLELLKGRLRQGWSWHSDFDLNRGIEVFASAVQANPYARLETISKQDGEAIFRKLAGMLAIRPGDLIIVPHQPEYDQCVAMLTALSGDSKTPYQFLEPILAVSGHGDFRHSIAIDPASVKIFSRESAQDLSDVNRAIWGRGGYASPVNFVRNNEVERSLMNFVGRL